jgi:hypothetical protein
MTAPRLALPMVWLVFWCGLARGGGLADLPAPAARQVDEIRLSLTGTVRMPDGSPAPGATVQWTGDPEGSAIVSRTDRAGRFELRGMFGNGAQLHASSADGNQQTTRIIPAATVRSISVTPIVLTLAPSIKRAVIVRAEGRPVEGALVVASGHAFRVHGLTGPDGKVQLRLPAEEPLRELVAWHRELGVNGARELGTRSARDRAQLSLLPPAPVRIRVVDPAGQPVRDLELGINIRTKDSDWAVAAQIEAAHVRTDADGTAVVLWAPREDLKYVEATPSGSEWKFDSTDVDRISERMVTVHARRETPVAGRLVMPQGANPEGILITGHGFGPGNSGDIPYARARADGSFTLRVPSYHAYILGIVDLEWASNTWSGLILGKDTSKPADLTISVYRAAPLTVRVTRGAERVPVADAWVEVGSRGEVKWVDPGGKTQTGSAGTHCWLRTDGQGVARAGAGRGQFKVRLSAGNWDEERTIVVSSDKPVEVAFHRPWEGERRVTGRLLVDGKPFEPSPTMVAAAWAPRDGFIPTKFKPQVDVDGTFQVTFDAEKLTLLFRDPEKRRSGFAQVDREKSSVDVKMVDMAADSGTLLDDNGKPMPGQTLTVDVRDSGSEPVATVKTDEAGRFEFAALPADVKLYFWIESGSGRPEYLIRDDDRLFAPREVREKDEVKARRVDSQAAAPVARPSAPLADRVANTCRNVRSSGMHTLVALQGDDSKGVVTLTNQLLDDDRDRVIWRYLAVRVEAAELKAEAATLKKYGWPVPTPGQVVLVALDGDQRAIATKTIDTTQPDAALATGDGFLKQHLPAIRDARAMLDAARDEARKSGRRVWIIQGGPRCGPCFRLGRWIDEHHATLEKDYVIVKVMDGLDKHATEVVKELPIGEGDGIPWYAITEPDGTILATSRGALGNIGFPDSVEGLRHFRAMLDRTVRKLTAAEVDSLIQSLSLNRKDGPSP